METLRQVVDFTGVAGPAGQQPGAGTRFLSLRSAGDLVAAAVPEDQRRSLRSLAAALPGLPPFTLDARITDHQDVVTPSRPIIGVDVSAGAVVETVVNFFSGGVLQHPQSSAVELLDGQRVDGAVFADAVFAAPGQYEAVVRRVGVTGAGVVTLERRLPFRVRAVPSPPPPPPSPPPPPVPVRLCMVERDPDQPGFGGVVNVRVSGSGFVPDEALVVRQDGVDSFFLDADRFGSFSVTAGLLDSFPPVTHTFQARSRGTGAASNVAGFTA